MTRLLIGLLLVLSASPVLAEGPGTRIRSGSQLPRPPQIVQHAPDTCARLQGAERERCIQDGRRPAQREPSRGPGSTGMGSGAGGTSTSGTTGGGGSFGASAPR